MDDDAEIIAEFLVESHENLDQLDRDLVELEQQPDSRDRLSSIFRTIHTIKGTSGFLAFNRLEQLTHVGETLLSRLRDGDAVMTPAITEALLSMVDTVRALLDVIERTSKDTDPTVDVLPLVALIEGLLEVGLPTTASGETPSADELSVAEVSELGGAVEEPDVSPAAPPTAPPEGLTSEEPATEEPPAPENGWDGVDRRTVVEASVRVDIDLLDDLVDLVGELVLTRNQLIQRSLASSDIELVRASQRLDLVASELQESVMKTRMQPIGQVWSKLPRVVRDLSHQLGREVELVMDGHETELDRSLLEAVKDPLTHLVRNSLDHGIERPEDRLAAGKPAKGTLSLRAYHESGQVVVEISDDGKGIDPDRIAAVAIERGVVTRDQLSRMDAREVLGLIFRPGFSTAAAVSNISGRGVGMDVVRTNIERIGGSVDVTSEVGRGTTTRVRIPLTLAIIPALVVGEGEERYAIPQANLVELVRIEGDDLRRQVEDLAGAPVLRLRGKLLPLVSLAEILGGPPMDGQALTVVVLQSDDVRFGLCVSTVFDTQEIVVKPIGRQLKALAMYAGATIMGDGRVALILDVAGTAVTAGVGVAQQETNDSRVVVADDRTALLVLEVSDGRRAALPLAAVSRLEEFGRDRIERSGATEVVQYRDGILPLVRLATAIGLTDTSDQGDQISVVVHETTGAAAGVVGIVIDRVLDVVDVVIVSSQVGRRDGVTGSAVVQDRVTDLVDLAAVVARSGVPA
ncbi:MULTISPECIES: chemotaxis protein CheA [unclassified Nocardioides]|uniref:chemotaxis protein CheA n=1 Tax=unclassified Nocardioides TaxID=2615069 RepID=UPI0006F8920B|nr:MULTISPECIES: chemotaxis protein CheA [unclassified Nocardioides]KRA31172.1 histidine kinase [Nocardioides sp. Root614]KRA87792.1 histidine kinase [Nocardioides sp. Root682]